ncbi:MAG: hypothetical protein LBT21_06490 [Oscillospiraceae bacterium]|jgi:hypothetical protein|nr:hypothetical protein [Oscillospiraceae bacterium]
MCSTSLRDWIRRTAIVLTAFCLPYAAFSAPARSEPPGEIRYTLREYSGELAVFRDDEATPWALYEVPVDTLPDGDREQLKAGISVIGEEKLRHILEDYTS